MGWFKKNTGVIILWHQQNEKGVIKGDDGKTYTFHKDEINEDPIMGMRVKFRGEVHATGYNWAYRISRIE